MQVEHFSRALDLIYTVLEVLMVGNVQEQSVLSMFQNSVNMESSMFQNRPNLSETLIWKISTIYIILEYIIQNSVKVAPECSRIVQMEIQLGERSF